MKNLFMLYRYIHTLFLETFIHNKYYLDNSSLFKKYSTYSISSTFRRLRLKLSSRGNKQSPHNFLLKTRKDILIDRFA